MGAVSILSIGFFVFAIVFIFLIYQLMLNLQPTRGKMKKDLRKLREEIQPWVADLVPLEGEELELLSLNQINSTLKKRWSRVAKGIFTSIFHEPLVAYAYRKYPKKERGLMLVRTANHELVYEQSPKGVRIAIDGQEIGLLKNNSLLYSRRSNRLLGRINRDTDQKFLPVEVANKEVATLINPDLARATNPRVFELIQPMEEQEELVLLALSVYEMVQKKSKA